MDNDIKPGSKPANAPAQSDQSVDEFFTRLQSEMRRPDVSQEAVTAAFHAIQNLALDSDSEEAAAVSVPQIAATPGVCPACGSANAIASRFCAACGAPLQSGAAEVHAPAAKGQAGSAHHYHHHYHHHYFSATNGAAAPAVPDAHAATPVVSHREAVRHPSQPGAPLSRAEIAVRKMSQNWALACNTKHLDDLVELYTKDALVFRANFPPIRGTAAIREFFFSALDAGLGEAEMEPLRVEVFGDVAYEAGRCKTLVPTPAGKRREERGKYLMLFIREAGGDWKTMADCWSSDLSLVEAAAPGMANPPARPLRK